MIAISVTSKVKESIFSGITPGNDYNNKNNNEKQLIKFTIKWKLELDGYINWRWRLVALPPRKKEKKYKDDFIKNSSDFLFIVYIFLSELELITDYYSLFS